MALKAMALVGAVAPDASWLSTELPGGLPAPSVTTLAQQLAQLLVVQRDDVGGGAAVEEELVHRLRHVAEGALVVRHAQRPNAPLRTKRPYCDW